VGVWHPRVLNFSEDEAPHTLFPRHIQTGREKFLFKFCEATHGLALLTGLIVQIRPRCWEDGMSIPGAGRSQRQEHPDPIAG
jgi:hypothetical protein